MEFIIFSPDGNLSVKFHPGTCTICFKNEEVIDIGRVNGNGKIIEVERGKIDEIYEFKYGKQRKIRNLCNTAMVKAVDKEKEIAIEYYENCWLHERQAEMKSYPKGLISIETK